MFLYSDIISYLFLHYINEGSSILNFVSLNKLCLEAANQHCEAKKEQLKRRIEVRGKYFIEKYDILPNRIKHGIYESYSVGAPLQLCDYYHYSNGKKHGLCKTFAKGGMLKSEATYINDNIEGMLQIFYDTGVLREESYFKTGKREGLCKIYHPNGVLKSQVNYQDQMKFGVYLEWDDTGTFIADRLYYRGNLLSNTLFSTVYINQREGI